MSELSMLSKMKQRLKAVARRVPLPRAVKKVGSTPLKFPLWNRLPNEIKALFVQKLDVKTSVLLQFCGPKEAELVRKHTKHLVNISMVYCINYKIMRIELNDGLSEETKLEWYIHRRPQGGTKVLNSSFKPRKLILKDTNFEVAVSNILRRLLNNPMFVVKELKLLLQSYNNRINLGSTKANIETLALEWCEDKISVLSILENKNLNFGKVLGYHYPDRKIIYTFDNSTYGRPRSLPESSPFPRDLEGSFIPFLCRIDHRRYQNAYKDLKLFWNSTLGLYNIVDRDDVNQKLKLRNTVEDITCLQAAFNYHDSYENRVDIYCTDNDKIPFLKDGIDNILSDYQSTLLTIAYLVRLFRNEPEIGKIHDIAFEDLQSALKKYENVNLYEKLVGKLETLLP